MTTDDETAAESLTRHVAGDGATATCPDGNLLAGFAERTLTVAETEAVATHASGCAACRSALVDLTAALGVAAGAEATGAPALAPALGASTKNRARARLAVGPRLYAAAALVLVAAGAGIWALARERSETPTLAPEQRLMAVARDLAAAHSALAGFVPLAPDDLEVKTAPLERGGIRLVAPSDVVLPGRPTFRWLPVGGVTRYEVRLAKDGGPTLFTRTSETPALEYPADAPALEPGGRYVWTVAVEAVLGGRTEARRTFAVATPETSAKFAALTRALAEHAPEDLVDLLAAHWALRHDLVAEAERFASAYSAKQRSDALGMRTLLHVWRRQGVPEGQTGPRAPGSR